MIEDETTEVPRFTTNELLYEVAILGGMSSGLRSAFAPRKELIVYCRFVAKMVVELGEEMCVDPLVPVRVVVCGMSRAGVSDLVSMGILQRIQDLEQHGCGREGCSSCLPLRLASRIWIELTGKGEVSEDLLIQVANGDTRFRYATLGTVYYYGTLVGG